MAPPPVFQSLGTRVAILVCFWIALLLSIHPWLRLTTIQRLPLPTRQVEALRLSQKCPVTFQASLTVLVHPVLLPSAPSNHDGVDASGSFLTHVQQLVHQSLQNKAALPHAASLECTRWNVDARSIAQETRHASLHPETGTYVVQALANSSTSAHEQSAHEQSAHEQSAHEQSAQEAQHTQHASLPTVYLPLLDAPSPLPVVPHTVSAAVVAELLHLRGDKVSTCASGQASDCAVSDTEQDRRVIQYSKHIRLVFSIMNQDITDAPAYDSHLIHALADANDSATNPIARLTRELGSLHDFHIETQVQWFAPLHFQPTREVLEHIVESQVEQEVMVDHEIEEEFEVELEPEPFTSETSVDGLERVQPAEVHQELRAKRTEVVRRKRTVQVPTVQRVVKQVRTPLPPRYVVEWDDLQVFVNSQEWSLTSTVPPVSSASCNHSDGLGRPFDILSQTHDLHFLLYIPSRSHSPLLLRDPSTRGINQHSNAWLIPQWGGVVILNTQHDHSQPPLHSSGRVKHLPTQSVDSAITLFARQLDILLGLGDAASDSALVRHVRLAMLKQTRILELARESINTLEAIIRLTNRIENLGIGPHVKTDTEAALEILTNLARDEAMDLDGVLNHVSRAHSLANRAFFNPNMLELLYFPDEHKYAVYIPLFVPLLVPLLVTTIKLTKEVVVSKRKSTQA